jgi:hypothetical protein
MPFFMNVRRKCLTINAKLFQTEVLEKSEIHILCPIHSLYKSHVFKSYTIGSYFAASSHNLRTVGVILVKFSG